MPVDVVNLALPGFDVFNSKINYLCYGRAFHPDAIIVYHTWNDMKQFRGLAQVPYLRAKGVSDRPLWQRVARATQIGRRGRNFLWTVRQQKMENKYRVEEGTSSRADLPVDPRVFEWERRNFLDFVILARSDSVLPILVSQASLVSPENIADPAARSILAAAPETIGMTLPVILDAWVKVSAIIRDVAAANDAIFVDGYNAVPHDLEHLEDWVHLRDTGSDVLADEIATVLTQDRRFLDLADRVRQEPASRPN